MAETVLTRRRQAGAFSIRWDPVRAEAAYAEGWWICDTLADALTRAAAEEPERVLVTDAENHLTSKGLYQQATMLAQALLARMPAGSVVSFMLPNWHETVVIYLAVTIAGMVAHPVLPSLRDHDLHLMLRDVRSQLLFIPENYRNHDYPAMMKRIAPLLDPTLDVVVLRGDSRSYLTYQDMFAPVAHRPLPALDPDAVRLVLYTSGTTGRSKGVLHTHNSMNALLRQLGQTWLVSPGDIFLVPSPISHIGGSIYAFEAPLLLGTSAVLMDRWDAPAALKLAASHPCTHICGATPFLEQLLSAARETGERLPRLKLFVCGGASVPPSLIRNAAAHFDQAAVTRVYGLTEVPVTTVGTPDRTDLQHAAETDGRPGAASVKLRALTVHADGEGEVLVRGPQMLLGYVHPEDEDAVFDDDGYYRTGDLGRWVDTEYLLISGRAKDIIIRNGENISPKEIEDILVGHPQIAEIAIVAIADERTGERSCAVIVPAILPGPDLPALRRYLHDRGVAAFKIPEQVVLWKALPKNDTGKVLKHRIRSALDTNRLHDAHMEENL